MFSTIRKITAAILFALGAYAAFIVYQESLLAAVIVIVLTLCLAIPVFLSQRKAAKGTKLHIGENPSTKAEHGLRQARAAAMREEGEIAGAPAAKV